MIDYEQFCKIKLLKEQKALTSPQIARELGLDVRTVAKWIDEKTFKPRAPALRPSKLDAYKGEIVRMIETHPYTAAQIFYRLQEQGFDGGYTIVKEYVRKIRPAREPAYLSLAFAPAECAQVDWGSWGSVNVGGTRRRLSFFVMVLCYSRMMYVEFTVSQTMEHFLACHDIFWPAMSMLFRFLAGLRPKSWSITSNPQCSPVLSAGIRFLIPSTLILPIITALPLSLAMWAKETKKAVWKMPWVMSKRIFSPVWISRILMPWGLLCGIGQMISPMSGSTAPPGKNRLICLKKKERI